MTWLSNLLTRWRFWLKYHKPIAQLTEKFSAINGYALSKQDRANQDDLVYTYGEIDWWGFAALLSQIKLNATDVFYDLGSGTGKAVALTAKITPIKKTVGIEYLPSLAKASQDLLVDDPKINIIQGDYQNINWSDGTIVFINATSLFGEAWNNLVTHLSELKPGARIIITSKKLTRPKFRLTYDGFAPMSWGSVSVRIYKVCS